MVSGRSAEVRRDLRRRLPTLLREAPSGEQAARAAIQACCVLGSPIPADLLTTENIAAGLTAREIVRALNRLGPSEVHIDLSPALRALRTVSAKELSTTSEPRLIPDLNRAVTKKLLQLTGNGSATRRKTKDLKQIPTQRHFTAGTVSSAADLALWLLRSFPETKKRNVSHAAALEWVRTIRALWRRTSTIGAIEAALTFLRGLRSVLTPPVYAAINADPSVVGFLDEATSALTRKAQDALRDGRLKDLIALLALAETQTAGRTRLLLTLQDVCQKRPFDLQPHVIEWVARNIEADRPKIAAPEAVDESQSSALDTVSLCLLSAWDSAGEGNRSARTLESVRRMARELFKLELVGTNGEIVAFDERQHELTGGTPNRPDRVRLKRPAVHWSDGLRTRVLVRAVVEPASQTATGGIEP